MKFAESYFSSLIMFCWIYFFLLLSAFYYSFSKFSVSHLNIFPRDIIETTKSFRISAWHIKVKWVLLACVSPGNCPNPFQCTLWLNPNWKIQSVSQLRNHSSLVITFHGCFRRPAFSYLKTGKTLLGERSLLIISPGTF